MVDAIDNAFVLFVTLPEKVPGHVSQTDSRIEIICTNPVGLVTHSQLRLSRVRLSAADQTAPLPSPSNARKKGSSRHDMKVNHHASASVLAGGPCPASGKSFGPDST